MKISSKWWHFCFSVHHTRLWMIWWMVHPSHFIKTGSQEEYIINTDLTLLSWVHFHSLLSYSVFIDLDRKKIINIALLGICPTGVFIKDRTTRISITKSARVSRILYHDIYIEKHSAAVFVWTSLYIVRLSYNTVHYNQIYQLITKLCRIDPGTRYINYFWAHNPNLVMFRLLLREVKISHITMTS